MVKELSIILDQHSVNSFYTTGSVITGSLIIEVNKPKNYKQITVCLKGTGTVSWSVTEGSGEHRRTRTYRATETYVNEGVILWKKENSPNGTFPAGRHTYPFQFTLPTNCPSSHQGSVGKIVYAVQGVISTGMFKFDHKVQHPIQVHELVSANNPHWLEPIRVDRRKTVHSWLCAAGQITYNIEIERSRFNVGENIPLSFYVENGSGRRLTVRCKLVETVNYYAQGDHRRSTNRAAIAYSEPINPHSTSDGQNSVRLPIPTNLRPAVTHSNIIKSQYTVVASLTIPWASNVTTVFPVFIGTQDSQPLNVRTQPIWH